MKKYRMAINVKVSSSIVKPIDQVFDAIVNPEKIIGYFVSGASAPLSSGKKIHWEFKDYNVKFEINVLSVVPDKFISFEWEVNPGNTTVIKINLVSEKEGQTHIEITENSFESNEEGINKAMQQTQGWTDFICSLKAYLYTGVNLRNGQMN
jgi:uncharacterized protein YndB with AHSA1/START domain